MMHTSNPDSDGRKAYGAEVGEASQAEKKGFPPGTDGKGDFRFSFSAWPVHAVGGSRAPSCSAAGRDGPIKIFLKIAQTQRT